MRNEKEISRLIDFSNLVLAIQLLLIYSLLHLCERIHLRPNDAIAIVFCGSQKSLTTGSTIRRSAFLTHRHAARSRHAHSSNDFSREHVDHHSVADLSSDADHSR